MRTIKLRSKSGGHIEIGEIAGMICLSSVPEFCPHLALARRMNPHAEQPAHVVSFLNSAKLRSFLRRALKQLDRDAER